MIWLIKKILSLAILAALIVVAMQFQVGGRPLKDYVIGLYRAPIVQEGMRQAKEAVTSYLQKDVQSSSPTSAVTGGVKEKDSAPMDRINDDERQELEKVLKSNKASK